MRKWAGRKGGRLKRECVGDWLTGGDKKGGMDDERNRGCGLAGRGGGGFPDFWERNVVS